MAPDKEHTEAQETLTQSQLEQIAELIDGRLNEDERAAVLRLLSESREASRVHAESVALLQGTGQDDLPDRTLSVPEPDARPDPVAVPSGDPAEAPRLIGPWKRVADLLAVVRAEPAWKAVLSAAVAAGLVLALWPRPAVNYDPTWMVASLGAETLAQGLDAGPVWSASRGASPVVRESGVDFRLGVSFVDAEAAILVGRTGDALVAIESMLALLDRMGALSPATLPLRAIREGLSGAPVSDSLRRGADVSLELLLGASDLRLQRYRFGKGAEATRFALLAGNASFVSEYGADYLALGHSVDLASATGASLRALMELIVAGDFSEEERARMLALLGSVMTEAAR